MKYSFTLTNNVNYNVNLQGNSFLQQVGSLQGPSQLYNLESAKYENILKFHEFVSADLFLCSIFSGKRSTVKSPGRGDPIKENIWEIKALLNKSAASDDKVKVTWVITDGQYQMHVRNIPF